jgi:hypothetical protein
VCLRRDFFHDLFVKGDAAFHAAGLPPAAGRKNPGRDPACCRINQTPRPAREPNQEVHGISTQVGFGLADPNFPVTISFAGFARGARRNFASPVSKNGRAQFSQRQRLLPARARHPVHPAAAQKTKPSRALCKKSVPSGGLRKVRGCHFACTAGEIISSRARIFSAKRLFLKFHCQAVIFGFFLRASDNCARHFSTRSLIFFSTPCSVGS